MSYTAPGDPLAGTGLDMFPRQDTHVPPPLEYMDVSLESPDQQFQMLTQLIEDADQAHPTAFTGTPPWGESTPVDDLTPPVVEMNAYMVAPDLEQTDDALGDPLVRVRDPFPLDYPGTDWVNDPQQDGLGVPPGMPQYWQPVESGHTQIIRNNPAAENGWDQWSGRSAVARTPHMQSDNPFYALGVNRRHGVAALKLVMPYVLLTQQYRDMLLAELKRRGIHGVVISDVPSVPFTENVIPVDPLDLVPEAPIGREGVLPWDLGAGQHHGDHLASGGGDW